MGKSGRRTINSVSLESSMTFRAVSVRVVRPSVSMNVRWSEMEEERRGMGVEKWTFLFGSNRSVARSLTCPVYARGWGIRSKGKGRKGKKTYVAPSGNRTLTSTLSYPTPSAIFGPSRKGILSTYSLPPPTLIFRRKPFRSASHPILKLYFHPPKTGYRGLISRFASRRLLRKRLVETLPMSSVK